MVGRGTGYGGIAATQTREWKSRFRTFWRHIIRRSGEMKSAEQKIAEIRKPPSLANWVRLNARRRDDTARKIAQFVLSKPRHALAQVYRIIADYVTLGISIATAHSVLGLIGNPLVRKLGREISSVLLPWLDKEGVKGIEA